MSLVNWGGTTADAAADYPCDALLPSPHQRVIRVVEVDAAAPVVFRWLCQLRYAPYSYDWIDNLGRRSPRTLTPGADDLALGQRFMTIYRLASFAPGDHLTLTTRPRPRGLQSACTYRVRPCGAGTRLVVCASMRYPRGPVGAALAAVFPAGDLVMMRKQLLTLKRLAESPPPVSPDHIAGPESGPG